MAAISSLGIGSDLLNNELLDNIINAEKAAAELRLDSQQQVIDAKISAYGDIQSKLYDFSSAIVKLADSDNAGATKATSSDESILTATASTSAPAGVYDVEVQRTAKANSLVSQSYATTTGALNMEGDLNFRLGTTSYSGAVYDSFSVNTDASTKTVSMTTGMSLSDLRDEINKQDFGVQASIVNDGTGYVLQLTSEDTGEKNSMEIIATDASGALATSGISAFAYNKNQATPVSNMTQTQQGQDAIIIVNGLAVTRESNEVTELIDGVTLSLKSEDVGTNVSISVGADVAGISENIQEMIDAYNEFQDVYKELTKFDSDSNTGSLLLGDSTLRGINSQIKSMMTSTVDGIVGTSFRSLSELGIYSDQNDDFKLAFNSSKFIAGLNESREAVSAVFSTQGTVSDSALTYMNESINTKSGTYAVEITQLATQGTFQGGSVDLLDFSSPVEINDANDVFTLGLNGRAAAIELTQGSYATGDDLAAEIQLQINSAKEFKDYGYSAAVVFDAANKSFDITSNKYGSDSEVYIAFTDTNTANTLGFSETGKGEYKGTELSSLNTEYFNGYGTSSVPSLQTVNESDGINFSASNATFSLSLNGAAAEAVTINLDASGSDLNGDSIFGDRKDILQAIQTGIDANGVLNGNVTASFDNNDKLVLTTTNPSATDSIEITAVGSNSSDVLLGLSATDGARVNGKDAGLTFGANVDFQVELDGTTSANTVSLPAGTYLTGNDLAAAVQAAINTDLTGDANLSGLVSNAVSNEGSRNISTNIDFTTANSGFVLNVNGNEQTIIMDADSGNNITDIQTKLDAAYGAGVVTASLGSGNGLELTNAALPASHDDYIQVVSDGRGAFTNGGAVIAGGIDFSGVNNATFDLEVDGVTLNLDVNTDASGGDKTSTLSAVQSALDLSILSNSAFEVGDVVAKLDSVTDQIYFETVSNDGIKTAGMFGSGASIEIKNTNANAQTMLGLPVADTVYNGGYDNFGLDNDFKFGTDIDAEVSYEYDGTSDKGRLVVNIGGHDTTVSFASVDPAAITFLGIHEPDGSESTVKTGNDVEGTINGIEAIGTGQFLSAQNGNKDATNGYYIADQSDIINTGSITVDATNDTFTIEVDGFESSVTVAHGTYGTGELLAEKISDAINEDPEIKAEKLSVKVEYTDDISSALHGKIGIISTSTGSESKVLIKDANSDVSTAYGFVIGQADGEPGKAQDGEIDDASGIRIKVTGGDLGDRGTVSYVSGIADQLKDLMQNILDPKRGILATKFNALDAQNETLQEDKESFDKRISAKEAQLAAQFAYNDSLIATLNTTASFLTSQFEAMAASQKK